MENNLNRTQNKKEYWLWAAYGVGLLAALWIQWSSLNNPAVANDDLRNLYWLHRVVDSSLFDGDTLVGHQLLDFELLGINFVTNKFSPGYGVLFALSQFVGSVILFSKLLIFPLMLIAIYFLYRLGLKFTNPKTAFALCCGLVALNFILSSNISVVAGLQRSFALPLILALLYYLSYKKHWQAALILFLSSSIYPPIFILGAATYGFSLIKFPKGTLQGVSIELKPIVPLVTAVLLSALLLLPAVLTQGSDQIATSLNDSNSNWSLASLQEGRYPLFIIFPFVGAGGVVVTGGDGANVFIMALIALGMKLLLKQRSQPLPPIVGTLVTASLFCFVISWLAILITRSFLFYLPSRYTQSTIAIFLLFYFVLNGKTAMQLAAQKLTRISQKPITMIVMTFVPIVAVIGYGWFRFPSRSLFIIFAAILAGLWFAIVIMLVAKKFGQSSQNETQTILKSRPLTAKNWLVLGSFIFIAVAIYGRLFNGDEKLSNTEQSLVAYLQTLPKDIRLGGTPCVLDNVPLFAKRMILFSCETPSANPMVMQEALQSYYAEDGQTINTFCQKYDVDYLVIDQNSYADAYIQQGEFLFEPFDSFMRQKLSGEQNYILDNLSPEEILFQKDSLIVTSCRPS